MLEQLDYQEIQAFDVLVKYRRMPLHIHNVHEFFYCYEGGAEQLVSQGIERMRPGELFFFPAGDPHRGSGLTEVDCRGAVINFGEDAFYGLTGGEDLPAALQLLRRRVAEKDHRVPLSRAGAAQAGTLFRAIVDENRTRQTGYRGAMLILAQQLLLLILREADFPAAWRTQTQPGIKARIDYAQAYLGKNCFRPVSVAEICRELKMSRSHFHAAFLRQTGTTMVEYLNRLRCRQAVRMLREGHAAAETARYCGFGSLSSFYRALRRNAGDRPGDLRGAPNPNGKK